MSKERILIAEDEFIIALELQSIVEELGGNVVGPAATLDEALPLANQADITGAILDLRLGRSSVEPVAKRLSERGIPFMFYSGQPNGDPILVQWPNVRLISKPATSATLTDCVLALLSGVPAN